MSTNANRKVILKAIVFAFLVALCFVTILLFADMTDKELKAISPTADAIEYSFEAMGFAMERQFLAMAMVAVLGASAYGLWDNNKSRRVMVPAAMAGLSGFALAVLCWGWMICTWCYGPRWGYSQYGAVYRIQLGLTILRFFLLVCPVVWIVCLLLKKLVPRMRRKLDTPLQKRGFRKMLQWLGIVFTVFSLAMLLLTLWYTFRIMSDWDEMQLKPEWYIGVIVHGAAAIIAGVELILGIRFLLNRSHGKVPVGALLLGSSTLGFFTLWMCIANTMSGVIEGSFHNSNIYYRTILCVVSQRVVCLIAILVSAWLCRRKKKNA